MVKYSDCPAQDFIEHRHLEETLERRVSHGKLERARKEIEHRFQTLREIQAQQFQNVPEN